MFAVRSLPKRVFPVQFSECAALFYYRHGDTIDKPSAALHELTHKTISAFITENNRVNMTFRNGFDFPVEFFWEDEAVSSKLLGRIEPGSAHNMKTALGHLFYASRIPSDAKNAVVDYMLVTGAYVRTHSLICTRMHIHTRVYIHTHSYIHYIHYS